MFEQIGLKNLAVDYSTLNRLLKPQVLFLNHGITHDVEGGSKTNSTEFINRYVFPDGQLDTVSNIQRGMERARFEITDVEGLRPHYALTLRHWVSRLEQHHEQALQYVSESTYRVWRLYMAACALEFESGEIGIYQVVASKRASGSGLSPLTRRHMYPPTPARASLPTHQASSPLPLPSLQDRLLQRARTRSLSPRLRREPVHRVEMDGRLSGRLSAGQEEDARHGRWHESPQDADRLSGDLGNRCLLRLLLAGNDHARFEQHVLENQPVSMQGSEDFVQDGFGHLGAALESMAAVHQHLGLDDRHDAFVLADRGVTGQRVRVGLDREPAWQRVGDVVDRTPLREARALSLVVAEALGKAVQSLRDLIAGRMRERKLAGVDLDAGHDALARDQLRQRYARWFSSVDSTPIALNRLAIVGPLSSAARMPLPAWTSESTVACN